MLVNSPPMFLLLILLLSLFSLPLEFLIFLLYLLFLMSQLLHIFPDFKCSSKSYILGTFEFVFQFTNSLSSSVINCSNLPLDWFYVNIILFLEILFGSFSALSLFISSVQFSSVAQSCLTLCDPMNRSTPGLPVHHQLPKATRTHVHRVGDAIQPSPPLSSPSPPALTLSRHQGLFQ